MRNLLLAACLAAALAPAAAEKADRTLPLTIEADQPGTIDLLKQVIVFNGNVVVSQGTLVIRADRVEVRESADGYRSATAIGSAGDPASFRQKRDGIDEVIRGAAERIEYDGRSDTVQFTGHASLQRVRNGAVADEISGNAISYDNTAEVFRVQGGPGNVTPSNPSGRVRAVLTPREGTPAAAAAAAAAASAASAAPLQATPRLGERR